MQSRGPTRQAHDRLDERRYITSGDRAYVVAMADGSFPPMGWHVPGKMGGVWVPPIRLLDGYWFQVNGQRVGDARSFTNAAGFVRMSFPSIDGLEIERIEFAPDGLPAVLVGLCFANPTSEEQQVDLIAYLRSGLVGVYPWAVSYSDAGHNTGAADLSEVRDGALLFTNPDRPWSAMAGASPAPLSVTTDLDPSRTVPPSHAAAFGTAAAGSFRWTFQLPPSAQRTLWLAVAGSHTSQAETEAALRQALLDPDALLNQHIDSRLALLQRSRLTVPDTLVQDAFDWVRLNLADLRRTVTDMQVRDVADGSQYPEPSATLPQVTGIAGGYPDYAWLFGTDGAYSTYGYVASGQWETAMDHLRAIRDISRAVNGSTGKVVHEVTTDGSVFYGNNSAPGDSNETAQFASAVHLLWRWSGDNTFCADLYPFIRDGMRTLVQTLTPPGTLWPGGDGIIERGGMGPLKLDVAVYTLQALHYLIEMARAQDDLDTAEWATGRARAMEAAFESSWWSDDDRLYADSLSGDRRLEQRHWICAIPLETGLASPEHAVAALDRLESDDFSGPAGLYHTGRGGGPDGAGELKTWSLPNAVMAVAEANYGRVGADQALRYIRAVARTLDLEMPGALPEILASPSYDPFGPLDARAMFMQAWSAYAVQWPVVNSFLGIRPNIPAGTLAVIPQIPPPWPSASINNLRVGTGAMDVAVHRTGTRYSTEVRAPGGLRLTIGHTLPLSARVRSVLLDGEPADYMTLHTERGLEIRVDTSTDMPHRLEVETVAETS